MHHPFSSILVRIGCSLGVRAFDPWPYPLGQQAILSGAHGLGKVSRGQHCRRWRTKAGSPGRLSKDGFHHGSGTCPAGHIWDGLVFPALAWFLWFGSIGKMFHDHVWEVCVRESLWPDGRACSFRLACLSFARASLRHLNRARKLRLTRLCNCTCALANCHKRWLDSQSLWVFT